MFFFPQPMEIQALLRVLLHKFQCVSVARSAGRNLALHLRPGISCYNLQRATMQLGFPLLFPICRGLLGERTAQYLAIALVQTSVVTVVDPINLCHIFRSMGVLFQG